MATVFRHKMNDPRGRSYAAGKARAISDVPVRFDYRYTAELKITLPTVDGKLLNITLDCIDIKALKNALGVS